MTSANVSSSAASPPQPRPRRRLWWLAGFLVVAGGVVVTTLAVDRLTQHTVTLDINGRVARYHTRATTVQAFLDDAHVLIDPEDVVSPAADTSLADGMTITVLKAHVVALRVDGRVWQVRTQAVHPLEVLAEQGVEVGAYDMVYVDGHAFMPDRLEKQPWDSPASSIRLVRSATVKVIDGEEAFVVHTTEAEVARVLDKAGVQLYVADQVEPALSTPVYNGLVVRIERSVPVTVVVDGRRISTRARGPTVGDALALIGIAPIGLDYTLPPVDAPLEAGMVIEVIRVTEKVYTQKNVIPFDTIYQLDPDLPRSEQHVIQSGAVGQRARKIWIRFENGSEVSRTVQDEWVTKPPSPRLIATGKAAD